MNPWTTATQPLEDEAKRPGEMDRSHTVRANGNALPRTAEMVSWNWQTLPSISTLMKPTMHWHLPTTSAIAPPTRIGTAIENALGRASAIISPRIPLGLLEPRWMPSIGIKQSAYQAPLSPRQQFEPPYLRVHSREEEEFLNVMRSSVEEERAFARAEQMRWQDSMKHAKELIDKDAIRNENSVMLDNVAAPVSLEVFKPGGKCLPMESVALGGAARFKATKVLPKPKPTCTATPDLTPSPQNSAQVRSNKKCETKEGVDLPAVTIPLDAQDIENDLCTIKGQKPPSKKAKISLSAQTVLPGLNATERVNVTLARPEPAKPRNSSPLKKRKVGRPRVSFPALSFTTKNETVDPQVAVSLAPRDAKVTAVESIKSIVDSELNPRNVRAMETPKPPLITKTKLKSLPTESTDQTVDASTEVETPKEGLKPMKKLEDELRSLNSKTMSESDETESDSDELEDWELKPRLRTRAGRHKRLPGRAVVTTQEQKTSLAELSSSALAADRDIELLRPTRFRSARIPVDENLEEAKRKIAQFLYFDVSPSLKGRLICSLCEYVTWPPNSRYHIVSCPEIQHALRTHSLQELKDLEAAKKDSIWQTEREMIVPSKVPGFILAHEPKGYAVCTRCKVKVWAPNAMRHSETVHPDVNPEGLEDVDNGEDDGRHGQERADS